MVGKGNIDVTSLYFNENSTVNMAIKCIIFMFISLNMFICLTGREISCSYYMVYSNECVDDYSFI